VACGELSGRWVDRRGHCDTGRSSFFHRNTFKIAGLPFLRGGGRKPSEKDQGPKLRAIKLGLRVIGWEQVQNWSRKAKHHVPSGKDGRGGTAGDRGQEESDAERRRGRPEGTRAVRKEKGTRKNPPEPTTEKKSAHQPVPVHVC